MGTFTTYFEDFIGRSNAKIIDGDEDALFVNANANVFCVFWKTMVTVLFPEEDTYRLLNRSPTTHLNPNTQFLYMLIKFL